MLSGHLPPAIEACPAGANSGAARNRPVDKGQIFENKAGWPRHALYHYLLNHNGCVSSSFWLSQHESEFSRGLTIFPSVF